MRAICTTSGSSPAAISTSGASRRSPPNAPIDGFGVGTALSTSGDAPTLDSVYKIQWYAGKPRRKRSEGKATWPGAKQVYRFAGTDGRFGHDLVALALEPAPERGTALLRPAMRGGRPLSQDDSLDELRAHAASQLAMLPSPLRSLDRVTGPDTYGVEISAALREMAAQIDQETH